MSKHYSTNHRRLFLIIISLTLTLLIATGCQNSKKTPNDTKNKERTKSNLKQSTLLRTFRLPTPLFSKKSAWNQKATDAKVLPESDEQILILYRVLMGDATDLNTADNGMSDPWPFIDVNYNDYSIPIFKAAKGEQSIGMSDYEGNTSESNPKVRLKNDKALAPKSAGTIRPAQPQSIDSDGHMVLYNPKTFIEYDFWQAKTIDGKGGGSIGNKIIDAGAIDFFDTRKSGANTPTYSSARATGTPLLAGLILPEDIEQGAIKHALSFAIPGLRNLNEDDLTEPFSSDYYYPVSTTETDYVNTHPNSLAAGQRIRLKKQLVNAEGEDLNLKELSPITQIFLKALQDYGAYVVDNAGGFTFSAEDIHTANLDLSNDEIKKLITKSKLPTNKTKWQVVIETLNNELENVPLAYGQFEDGADASVAEIESANFEVIENATR